MDCKEFSNLLDAFADGTLPDEEADRMRAHAGECASCAALLALRQDCRKLDEEIEVPDEFSSAWRQTIREEEKMEKKSPKKSRWRAYLAAAAMLVFVIGGTFLTRDSRAPRPAARPTPQASAKSNAASVDGGALRGDMAAGAVTNFSFSAMEEPREVMDFYADEEAAYDNEISPESPAPEKIIRTASFTLKTTVYEDDLEKIQALTRDSGGRVEYLSASGDASSGQTRSASLTVRIPSGRLDEFLDGAQAIGSVTSLTQEREDVSDSYYDIQTRLETQQAKLKRLQSLMQAAEDVSDVLEIESAIADAQYYIDRYTGQISSYDSRVDYSTVHISIREVKIQEAEDVSLGQRIASGLQDSLQEGLWFLEDMCVFLVSALPWLALIAAVIVAVCLIVKKRNPKKKG